MDPGFVSGFIGAAINILSDETLKALKVAIYCRSELKSLHEQLQRIMPLMDSAQSESQSISCTFKDDAVKTWLQTLQTLLKDANATVTGCTIPPYNVFARYRVAKSIKQTSKRIQTHIDNVGLINLVHQFAAHKDFIDRIDGIRSKMPVLRVQPVLEACVIGQEGLFQDLQDRILSNSNQERRIGITGMGGSGKTVLLKTVLNSEPMQDFFAQGLIVWLTVSKTPFPTLLRQLGRSIEGQAMEAAGALEEVGNEHNIKSFVRTMLRKYRFLIMLDDVWEGSEEVLEFLQVPQKRDPRDSKIVITSRDPGLLSKMGVKSTIALKPLTQEEGWELFKIHAFTDFHPGKLEPLARAVAQECKGLPLAIKTVGAAMAGRSHEAEQWQIALEKLRNADILYPEQEDQVFQRLRLSVDALNSNLRACFLYFAAYKEDAIIDVEDIAFLWNYEGLLGNSTGYGYLRQGRQLLNSLIDRCLIDVVSSDRNGAVRSCKIHDVLRDVALRIAEREEKCLFRAGKDLTTFQAGTFQRISVMDNKISAIPEDFQGPSLETLLLSANTKFSRISDNALRSLTALRILDLRDTAVQVLPESIGFLKQLICLRLSKNPIQNLPARSFIKLKRLQVLDLSECLNLTNLPEGISKLKSLQVLDLHGCESLGYLPLGLTSLVSLQVLKMENCFTSALPIQFKPPTAITGQILSLGRSRTPCLSDLKALTELRCLEIDNWKDTSIPEGTMSCFTKIERLILGMHSIKTLPQDMVNNKGLRHLVFKCSNINKLPAWMTEFQNLRSLKLFNSRSLEILPALDKLESLGCLEIHECDKLKALPIAFGRPGAFPNLRMLWLRKLEMLQNLPTIGRGSMPMLEVLGIEKCMQISRLPDGIKRLDNLKVLSIYGSRELIRATSQGGEDWKKAKRLQQDKHVKILKERNTEWINAFEMKLGDD
ncbi:hypothetical protein SUGI_0325640 [Cryptomeria japonica]|uniref:probable disease resistance protein At1g61300 n=1 Tax=Cryptomeria japonica TaxID=3369 RepID=UPI002408A90B|nr:probable disease resistance protein At1g61300 [Cryptomeria japonica]GLJ18388.1 hypothetical protein SUGI_0325640 [Cryptomeria japonica]